MPMAIPLIFAAVEVGAGVAAVAAATTIGAEVIGGMMIAGGALGAVGAVTHNKNLTTLGAVVGLAGGIGGAVTGAWSSAADALASTASDVVAPATTDAAAFAQMDAAGVAASDGSSAVSGAADAAAQTAGATGGAVSDAGSVAGGASTAAPTDPGLINSSMQPSVANPVQNLVNTSTTVPGPGDVIAPSGPTTVAPSAQLTAPDVTAPTAGTPTAQLTAPDVPTPTAPSTSIASPSGAADTSSTLPYGQSYGQGPGDIAPASSPGGGGGLVQTAKDAAAWMQANPRLTQAGAGLIQGGMNYASTQDAIKTKIALEEAALQRQRDRISTSVKNLKVPVYVSPKGS